MPKSSFYYVFNPNGYPPKHQHQNRQDAECEAERLVRANPNCSFFVCQVVREYLLPDGLQVIEYD